MTIGAPGSSVDPHLRQLERIGVRLSLRFESRPAAAEDWNFLCPFVFFNYNYGASKPFTRVDLLGIKLDTVTAIAFSSHAACKSSFCFRLPSCPLTRNGKPKLDTHLSAIELDTQLRERFDDRNVRAEAFPHLRGER